MKMADEPDSSGLQQRGESPVTNTENAEPAAAVVADTEKSLEGQQGDDEREVIETYARLLVACHNFQREFRTDATPTASKIRESVADVDKFVADYADAFVGLMQTKFLVEHPFVHGANAAVYALILADALKLCRERRIQCATAAATADADELTTPGPAESVDFGDESHRRQNLDSLVALMKKCADGADLALSLVTLYEGGFLDAQPLPSAWYDGEYASHLATRIIAIARDYDLLVQGFGEFPGLNPDLAAQALLTEMGSQYDERLVKLFVTTIGIYPVGSLVKLSDKHRAIVIRSPAPAGREELFRVIRPTVKTLGGDGEIIDLSDEEHVDLYILELLDEKFETHPGARWFFSPFND